MKNKKSYELRKGKGVADVATKTALDGFHCWAEEEVFTKKMASKQEGIFDKAKYLLYLFSTYKMDPDDITAFSDFIEIKLKVEDGFFRLNISSGEIQVHRFTQGAHIVPEPGNRVIDSSVCHCLSFERVEDVAKYKRVFIGDWATKKIKPVVPAAKKPAAKKS